MDDLVRAVLVEKIVRVQPDVSRIYLLVRATDAASAKQRVQQEVITNPHHHLLGAVHAALWALHALSTPNFFFTSFSPPDAPCRGMVGSFRSTAIEAAAAPTRPYHTHDGLLLPPPSPLPLLWLWVLSPWPVPSRAKTLTSSSRRSHCLIGLPPMSPF